MGQQAHHGVRHELALIARCSLAVPRLLATRYKLALGGATLLMVLTSVAGTAIPLLLGKLVDSARHAIQGSAPVQAMNGAAARWLAWIGVAYLLREVLGIVRGYLVETTCTRVDRDLTVRLVSHLLKVDLSTFTQERVGALHGRLSRSIEGFVRLLRLIFLDFFPATMGAAFALLATMSKQRWLGLVMLGVIPLSVGLTLWQLVSQKGVRLELLRGREQMDGLVVEQLSSLDYVRAANTHGAEARRVARSAEDRRRREIRHHVKTSLFGAAKALNEGLFHVLVLALAVHLAVDGRISFGDILTFSFLFLSVMTPLTEIHRLLDEAHESSLRVADLLDLLAEPTDRSFSLPRVREPDLHSAGPLIKLEGLRVDYEEPDGQHRSALDGVDLDVRRGESIGIAGPSGGGKTTVLKVLLRLTHPSGGHVLLGGVPLEHVSREAIARLIGYVGQSPFVFAGTIAENIAYGVEHSTREDLLRAAEMAGLHEEILAMPGGYDAPIAEHGKNLSGGQRQRLALARLFLKNPPMLILDEATSALDTINERHVQKALAATRRDRTVIFAAQRLSTFIDTDRIVVFDKGRIVESGTYDQLVAADGVFARLLRCAQKAGEGPGSVDGGTWDR